MHNESKKIEQNQRKPYGIKKKLNSENKRILDSWK